MWQKNDAAAPATATMSCLRHLALGLFLRDSLDGGARQVPDLSIVWFSRASSRRRAYRGRSLAPIRCASTARAHCRPSRIAQTTSDWPRRMSPAVKTLSTLVR